MNFNNRLVVSAVLVASLAACSGGAEQRRQAKQDFDYLNTKPLGNWTLPADAKSFATNDYAIPQQVFPGEVGSGVDIRPPQQVLELIPGARVQPDEDGAVTLWLQNSEELDKVWSGIESLIAEREIPIRTQTAASIETGWLILEDAESATAAGSRFQLEKLAEGSRVGVSLALVDWRQGSKVGPAPVLEKERHSVLMANLVTTHYDQLLREESRSKAQEQVKQIHISMGKDRSGLPVIIARAPYDIFWERLPTILQPLGFTVEDRNRSQGEVEVKFDASDDEFWAEIGTNPIELESRSYKLQLGDLGNRTSVNVTDTEGKPITEEALQSVAPALSAAVERANQAG